MQGIDVGTGDSRGGQVVGHVEAADKAGDRFTDGRSSRFQVLTDVPVVRLQAQSGVQRRQLAEGELVIRDDRLRRNVGEAQQQQAYQSGAVAPGPAVEDDAAVRDPGDRGEYRGDALGLRLPRAPPPLQRR